MVLLRWPAERVLSRYFYSESNHTQLPLSAAGWERDGAGERRPRGEGHLHRGLQQRGDPELPRPRGPCGRPVCFPTRQIHPMCLRSNSTTLLQNYVVITCDVQNLTQTILANVPGVTTRRIRSVNRVSYNEHPTYTHTYRATRGHVVSVVLIQLLIDTTSTRR